MLITSYVLVIMPSWYKMRYKFSHEHNIQHIKSSIYKSTAVCSIIDKT